MLIVAELPEFIHNSNKLLTESERQDIIRYLAEHPKSGDLMEGTGGVRKLLWGRGGQGKSGGVRVNDLAGLVKILVLVWKRKQS